jgi:hypothetical protein
MRECLEGGGVRNKGEVKSISQGADFRLKQLTNNTDEAVPTNNNMEIQLVQWFTLTGRN